MTKVFICPHFSGHAESLRVIEHVQIHCIQCGRLSWSNVIPPEGKAAQ